MGTQIDEPQIIFSAPRSISKVTDVVEMPMDFSKLTLKEIERIAIIEMLRRCNGNRAEAARKLGIAEKSIYNKMKRFAIDDEAIALSARI